jgi:hypothetical protein
MFKAVLTLCLAFLLFSVSFGQQSDSAQERVIFKANTEFAIQLETAVFSDKNNVGDDVNFVLNDDIIGDGDKIDKGSVIYGRIAKIDKISPKNDTTKVCIMFDYIKKGGDFIPLIATIIAIESNNEAINLATSPTFVGGTTFSLKGKEIQLDKGRVFRAKLTKDITGK